MAPRRPATPSTPRTRRTGEGVFDRTFGQAARWLLARGVHPNHFTFAQIPVFAAQIWAAFNGHNILFALLILLVMLLDGGDGILARVGKRASKAGAVLDASFDTVGIAIVLWGGSLFFPQYAAWFWLLFLGNTFLYLQNALLGIKVVSYVRGPTITAIAWPVVIQFALASSVFLMVWLVAWRLPATIRALVQGLGLRRSGAPPAP